jgi:hypothetical protein
VEEPGLASRRIRRPAHEFHGHARPVPATPPHRSGRTALVFDVPAGLRPHRILIDTVMVVLTGR